MVKTKTSTSAGGRVTSVASSMRRIERAGFEALGSLENLDKVALSYIADEAERLHEKYGELYSDTIRLGAVELGYPGESDYAWMRILLDSDFFGDGYRRYLEREVPRQTIPSITGVPFWYLKADASERVKTVNAFTHEFGHMLGYSIYRRDPDVPSHEYVDETMGRYREEIMNIAYTKYGNPDRDTANVSRYGLKDDGEFFAEVFAGYEGGYDTPVTRAMGDWLKTKGY